MVVLNISVMPPFCRLALTERHFRVNDHANLTDQPDQSVQNSSQVPEDHADVVTATAEHGKKRVALGSFQGASPQPTVVFQSSARLHCPSQEFGIVLVTPRFAPLMKTFTSSTPWPRYPRSTKISGRFQQRWAMLIMVVATLTLVPNS